MTIKSKFQEEIFLKDLTFSYNLLVRWKNAEVIPDELQSELNVVLETTQKLQETYKKKVGLL